MIYVREIGVKLRKSDKKCDAIVIDQPELDTVSIIRDRRMTMEAIMTRDQRTTSHRVLERSVNKNCNGTMSLYQSNSNESNKKPIDMSTASLMNQETERTNMTCRKKACYNFEFASTSKHKTDDSVKFSCCDTHRCLFNCRTDIRRVDRVVSDKSCNRNNRSTASRSSSSIQHRNNSSTWLRLASLLVLFLVASVRGAPTRMNRDNRRLSSPPKWVNPCGLAAEDFAGDLDVVQLKDEQLLRQIVVQAKTALDHAQLFRDDYIKRTFSTDFQSMRSNWKTNHYDWLPGPDQIPKQLGELLDPAYLQKLEIRSLDTALLDAYEYMQRFAVGLEQVVWDQEDHRLEFRKQFKDTEFNLRTVLCELQVALVERGVTPRPDITRDVMSSDYRNMSGSETYRNLRDWLIFRDYMNGLEYIVQIFDHLRRILEF